MSMNSDPLAGLRDIHLPPDIGWWPPALGWWFVLLLGILLVIFTVRKFWKFLMSRRYRKEALAELKMIQNGGADAGSIRILQDLAVLMRRVALHRSGRREVSDLSGDEWLKFLDRMGNTDDFTIGAGKVFGEEMYKATAEIDSEKVFSVVEKWIRKHK